THARGLDRYVCADGVAVADRPLKGNGDPPAAGRVVAQERRTIVVVHDEHVDVAVVVVVAERRAPAGLRFEQRSANVTRDVAEASAAKIPEQLLALQVRARPRL